MMGTFGAQNHVEAIKLHILSHLFGSLPFIMSTMHGHMNIKCGNAGRFLLVYIVHLSRHPSTARQMT
jgi:hypothetical protein